MEVTLNPDPADGRNVTVHTTFDELDGQNPQPWRLWIIELQDLYEVESGTEDQEVSLENHGVYTFEINSNTSTARMKYSTGEPGEPTSYPVTITLIEPAEIEEETPQFDVVLHGSGFSDSAACAMAVIGNSLGGESQSTSTTAVDDSTLNATFVAPPTDPPGSVGYIYTMNAQLEQSSNKIPLTWVEGPPPPVITSLVPDTDVAAGGGIITVKGTGLTGVTRVVFGNIDATGLTLYDDANVSCNAPMGPSGGGPGQVSVKAYSDHGDSEWFFPFTYTA